MSRQMVRALTALRATERSARIRNVKGASRAQAADVYENETHKSCDLLRHNSVFCSSHLSIDTFCVACTGDSRLARVLWERLRRDKEE